MMHDHERGEPVPPPANGDPEPNSEQVPSAPGEVSDSRRDAVVTGNIGISAGATAGSAATTAMMAGSAGATGAGTTSAGATAGGGALAIKIGAGAIGAIVIIGAVIVGGQLLTKADEPVVSPPEETADNAIEEFDFANAVVDSGAGEEYQLTDGRYVEPGYEGTDVGYHLSEGPVFADVDDDGDLDAATIFQWVPAAGTPTSAAFVWLWDGETARQVVYPITTNYHGSVTELAATDGGFTLTATTVDQISQENTVEPITVGMSGDYPVQTAPVYGSVDRCVESPDEMPGGRADGTAPLVAPDESAPTVGDADEFAAIFSVSSDYNTDEWTVARLEWRDGSTSCGWVPTEAVGQG